MAKKKFYYNKNKKNHKSNQPNLNDEIVRFTYSQEQLEMKVEELGLSEATETLLLNNKVRSAFDIVRRTPKDMYKIQGLNKKILAEIERALQSFDMKLSEPIEVKKEDAEEKQAPNNNLEVKAKDNKPQLNKERQPKKKIQEQKPVQEKGKKPNRRETVKITSPLPLESWRKVTKNGKWGFSDGMKVTIEPQYDEVFSFKEGLASVEINEKCGYIDENNNVVIPLDYETAFSFNEGYAAVSKNGLYGYIDKENNLVHDFKFDAATCFENGEAKVKQDGKWGTLTPDGEIKWI